MQNDLEKKLDKVIIDLDLIIERIRSLRDGAALKIKELESLPSRLSEDEDIPPLYDDIYSEKNN